MEVKWVKLEHAQHPSPFDLHLYETCADNCVKLGNPQEGIQTLQSLVHRNPAHLSGWLRLAALLLETGQVQQTLSTMKELTTLHPRYQEGYAILERLQNTYGNLQGSTVTTQGHHHGQPAKLNTIAHYSGNLK